MIKPPPISISDTKRHLADWQRRKAALLDFVAEFEDGRTITVGVCCSPPDDLDPVRGVFFARFVHPDAMRRAVLPKLVRARFESNGKLLASYDEAALAAMDAGLPRRRAPR
jgi:hypothetical protein